jgi:hypothetical protein
MVITEGWLGVDSREYWSAFFTPEEDADGLFIVVAIVAFFQRFT